MNKTLENKNYTYKVNQWLNLHYEEDYDHSYIIKILFDRVLHLIYKNNLALTCDKDVLMDYFIEYLYKHSSHKPYKTYDYN